MNYDPRFEQNGNKVFGGADAFVGPQQIVDGERLQSIGNKVQIAGEQQGVISSGEGFKPDEVVGNMEEEAPVSMDMPPDYVPEVAPVQEEKKDTVIELIGRNGEVTSAAVKYAQEIASNADDPHAMVEQLLKLTDRKAA